MNVILLSGGSGKRLWPLSNDIRSKQFIKIFEKPEHSVPMGTESFDDHESMVQRIYRQIKTKDPDADVTVATSKSQVSALHNQLGTNVSISVEPCRRDTFAAIALATAYLHDVKGLDESEAVVVCPVDPYVEDHYFDCVHDLYEAAQKGSASLVLMGIQPTYPSEKYGYIIPEGNGCGFREKPDAKTAEKYIQQGALWNGGVFAYRLSYVLNKARELLKRDRYQDLFDHYAELEKISFDYAVVEQEKDIEVHCYDGTWKDLGTWNTLTEAMDSQVVGDVRLNETCQNVHAVNELGLPILVMGMKNAVIAASPEGILVSDKEQSSYIKPFVDQLDQQVMFAEKSWGSFRVLDVQDTSLTIRVTLLPGHRLHYHSHENRDETWTVVSGEGTAVVDDAEIKLHPGVMLRLPAGCRHTAMANTQMVLIEVQMGENITVHDKKKYSLADRYGEHR